MPAACYRHAVGAIQIKHVPEDVHKRLRERARRRGITLSRYALEVLQRDLTVPSTDEWLAALAEDEPASDVRTAEIAQLIDEARGERDGRIIGALPDRH